MVKFLYSATAKTYFNCVIVILINISDKDIETINNNYALLNLFLNKFVVVKKKYKLYKTQNMNTTILGLDAQKTENLTISLNTLLSNFQVYYQNLRGLHWNIKGRSFFELHVKFEEFYTDSQEKIDMIAERILTLEGTPLHTFTEYTELSSVAVGKNVSNDIDAVNLVVNSLSELLKIERLILNESDDASDEGTNSMMSDFIAEQEKTIWMLKSWLN